MDEGIPDAQRMEVADFGKGPIHPAISAPAVIYGGVDGTKISKEEFPVRLTANELLEKMGMPVGGQVVTDDSKSTQTRKSHGMEGPLAKARKGIGKDPQQEDRKPPATKLAPIASKRKHRVADNEGPCEEGHTPMTNSKSAAFRFFAQVYEKLAYQVNPGDTGMGQVPPPSAMPPPPSPAVTPANAASSMPTPPPPAKTASWILGLLKNANPAGVMLGAMGPNEAGLGAKPMKRPELPEGNTMPAKAEGV